MLVPGKRVFPWITFPGIRTLAGPRTSRMPATASYATAPEALPNWPRQLAPVAHPNASCAQTRAAAAEVYHLRRVAVYQTTGSSSLPLLVR